MSLKLINGENVTSIVSNNREIKQLEFEIQKKLNPTDRDYVIYAYHFLRLGHTLLAQKYLNHLNQDYFDQGVYKDLAQSLLMWSLAQTDPSLKTGPVAAQYEFFVVIKRVLETFEEVNFITKPAFYRFRKQFKEFTTIPVVK